MEDHTLYEKMIVCSFSPLLLVLVSFYSLVVMLYILY